MRFPCSTIFRSLSLSVFAFFVSHSLSLTDWLTQKATAVCVVVVVGKLEHFAFSIFTILPSQLLFKPSWQWHPI